jgi:hypothetical protein
VRASVSTGPAAKPRQRLRAGGVASDGSPWSFDGVVRRVLGFSRAAELEALAPPARSARRASAALVAGAASEQSPAFDALRTFVRSLDRETRGKLQALMQAGREAQAVPEAVEALSRAGGVADLPELDLFAKGAAALQDLQRGHAVACATEFALELELSRWGKVKERASLDERVWLRFGRDLARSRVEEWSCLAVLDARGQLEKLYLRCGEGSWWSFGALIDRPSARELANRTSGKRGRSRVATLTLRAALAHPCRAELRAVRRASTALSARLGIGGVPERAGPRDAPGKVPT